MSEGERDMKRQNEQERFTQWLSDARHGDREAFDCLCGLDLHRPWLLAICRRLPRDLLSKIDPEDVIQEALIQVWHDIGDFQGESRKRFRGWVSAIVLNRLRDAIRINHRPKRDARRERHASHPSHAAAMRDDHTPSKSVARRELVSKFTVVLDELPESYRSVIEYRILEGLGPNETAKKMGITANNVSTKLFRALVKLRKLCVQHGIRSSILRP